MSEQHFLYKKLTVYLAGLLADNLGNPNYIFPPELEVAKSQQVSRITVRKAFAELENRGLIYRVKGSGTFISENATKEMLSPYMDVVPSFTEKRIGLIFPQFEHSQHIADIFAGILDEARDMNVSVSLSNMSSEREKELIHKYVSMNVDGIILYPIDNEVYNSELLTLSNGNFPLVLVDRYLPGLDFACVSSDHYGMVQTAVNRLLDKGHEHILFFNSNIKTNSSLSQRQEGYIRTLNERRNFNQYFFTFCGDMDPTSHSFAETFSQYLKLHPEITAIIASDYSSGIHLIQMMKILHIDYRKDFEIIPLDFYQTSDILGSTIQLPPYIQQDSKELGIQSVRLLRDIMNRTKKRNEKIVIPASLITD